MAHKITDACVSCGSCAENCPVEAISQGDTQYGLWRLRRQLPHGSHRGRVNSYIG